MSELLLGLARLWSRHALAILWQSALIFAVLWLATRLARRQSSLLRHSLWLLFLARLVLPGDLGLPVGAGSLARPLFASAGRPVDPVANAQAGLSVALILFGIWFAVAAGIALRLGKQFQFLRGALARAKPVEKGPLHDFFAWCAERIGHRSAAAATLWLSDDEAGPLVIGLRRPRIILPRSVVSSCTPAELETLLLHELAHVRRRDLLVNWIQVALQVLNWHNPLVWLANGELRRERELCCDDQVLMATGLRREVYGEGLIKVLRAAPQPLAAGPVGAVGMSESARALQQRLTRIMDRRRRVKARLTAASSLGLLVFGGVVLAALGPGTDLSPRASASPARHVPRAVAPGSASRLSNLPSPQAPAGSAQLPSVTGLLAAGAPGPGARPGGGALMSVSGPAAAVPSALPVGRAMLGIPLSPRHRQPFQVGFTVSDTLTLRIPLPPPGTVSPPATQLQAPASLPN